MTAFGATAVDAISVATLTSTAKDVLEGAFVPLWVKGEVSGFKAHSNGHWYFTLRDSAAQIPAVTWKGATYKIPAKPEDGMQVMAFGQLTVWPAQGKMQFSVTAIEAEGEGLWQKAFDELKAKLDREGLTDPSRKRKIPRFPRTVAVITSSEAAALRDIVSVIGRRHPGVQVVVIPAQVQGEAAPESLCAALERLERWVQGDATWSGAAPAKPDVLIIGRGGGSREDLWAFNNEAVARAIAACSIPTISAVGHETDFTIADLVADLRAATPSVAAESAVPVLAETQALVAKLAGVMADGLQDRIEVGATALHQRADALSQRARRVTERRRSRAEQIVMRLVQRAPRLIERRRATMMQLAATLDALSPLQVLKRGFSVARARDGAPLAALEAFRAGLPFELLVRGGRVLATTDAVHPDGPHVRSDV